VPKLFLDGPDIVAVLEQVRGMFGDPRLGDRGFEDAPEDRRVFVMRALLACQTIEGLGLPADPADTRWDGATR
jgi:hypothetical protein